MNKKILLLLLSFFVFAQITIAQDETINIECNLQVNQKEWIKDAQLIATLTVKNNSQKEVEMRLPPEFILQTQNYKIDNSSMNWGFEYGSREMEKDHIITKRTKNGYSFKIRQFFNFSLKSGESKILEFDLSKLAWQDMNSSIRIDRSWYDGVPKGNYNLYYEWGYHSEKSKDTRISISIVSNKIEVTLNSKK